MPLPERTPVDQNSTETSELHDFPINNTDRFKLLADLMSGAESLVKTLESEKEPNISEYKFSFDREHARYLPGSVLAYEALYGDISEIQIDMSHSRDDPTSGVTVRFVLGDDTLESQSIYSVDRPGYSQELPDSPDQLTIRGTVRDADRVPQSEINMFFASLCSFPSKTNDFSQFRALNPNAGELYAAFIDALQKNSVYFSSENRYELDSFHAPDMTGSFVYTVDDGQIVSAALRRILNVNLSIDENNTLTDSKKAIETEIDLGNGAEIKFYVSETKNGDETRTPMHADTGDFIAAIEFAAYHLNCTSPVQTKPLAKSQYSDD